jgi:hypothetical protein
MYSAAGIYLVQMLSRATYRGRRTQTGGLEWRMSAKIGGVTDQPIIPLRRHCRLLLMVIQRSRNSP